MDYNGFMAASPDERRALPEWERAAILRGLNLFANTYRLNVTVEHKGAKDEHVFYCRTSSEAGGLREAFESAHGSNATVVIWDQEQNRRVY